MKQLKEDPFNVFKDRKEKDVITVKLNLRVQKEYWLCPKVSILKF